ncbi:NUDIX hydrolase [Salinibacterium sp. SYSU T00001]|uniref:NUDIX hydrolase n=1 Tax=Homoserinimonas sedimenticola TaxID=2986805 RepID=UPI00223567EF|nr:NUDIX hydrolase [Salinibacterium sedimenticola]MCW4386113.1 NUDIX hydrolase [Salinibacterium sedimenticola]
MSPQPPVLAAGALCWRVVDGKIRVLLVHREHHDDISLPKGKVDPGESLPETAAREIEEETGLAIALGAPLGTTEYTLPGGRDKIVHYWTAEVDEATLAASTFSPNDEIAKLEWVSVKKARKALSYSHDRDVLDRFVARMENDTLRTFAVIALRHGKAVSGHSFDGVDAERGLLPQGKQQADAAARAIAAYRPRKLVTSDATRCVKTIKPLAKLTRLPVTETHKISQDAWENGGADVAAVVAKRLAKRRTSVLCSHGPVLPEIVEQVARQSNTALDRSLRASAMLDTGAFAVMHLSSERPDAGIIALEVHSPGRGTSEH